MNVAIISTILKSYVKKHGLQEKIDNADDPLVTLLFAAARIPDEESAEVIDLLEWIHNHSSRDVFFNV